MINRASLKRIVEVLMFQHKRYEKELYVYRFAFAVADEMYPRLKLKGLLKDARKSPDLRKHLRAKYGGLTVEKFLQRIDEEISAQEVEEFLASWTPTGPVH
jgi:hypothetical protein